MAQLNSKHEFESNSKLSKTRQVFRPVSLQAVQAGSLNDLQVIVSVNYRVLREFELI